MALQHPSKKYSSIGDTCIYSRYISPYHVCPRKNDISLVSFSLPTPPISLALSLFSPARSSFQPFALTVVAENPLTYKYHNRTSFFIKRINFFFFHTSYPYSNYKLMQPRVAKTPRSRKVSLLAKEIHVLLPREWKSPFSRLKNSESGNNEI